MAPRLLIPLRGNLSDAHLARRAASGDDEAFEKLYARYEPRLFAYCRSIVRHDEDARDATQNTMAKALVALRRHSGTLEVQAWLYRIAHNEAITVLRRRRPTDELPDALSDGAPDPARNVIGREELAATLDDVRTLPDRLRQPLLLRELAGLSYRQVAAVTGGTAASARKAVFEARSALGADRVGRDESCSVIRETLSDGDGRRRRARSVRSHLRSCDACRSWEHELRARRRRLSATVPAVGASGPIWGWIVSLFGSQAGGAGTTAAGFSGELATTAKIAAAVVVVAAGASPVVTREQRPAHSAGAQVEQTASAVGAAETTSRSAASPASTAKAERSRSRDSLEQASSASRSSAAVADSQSSSPDAESYGGAAERYAGGGDRRPIADRGDRWGGGRNASAAYGSERDGLHHGPGGGPRASAAAACREGDGRPARNRPSADAVPAAPEASPAPVSDPAAPADAPAAAVPATQPAAAPAGTDQQATADPAAAPVAVVG